MKINLAFPVHTTTKLSFHHVYHVRCRLLLRAGSSSKYVHHVFATSSIRPYNSHYNLSTFPQTSRNLLRSCQSFGQTDVKILSDRKIFCRSEKKSPPVMCIMFSLAFLECFTIVLAIGHLISPLVFIEVKVIQFLVFSVVQNCICYVFYSVCLVFGLSSFLALSHQSNASFLPSDSIFDDILIV